MKIAVITSTFPPYKGGMGNSAYEIAKILAVENNTLTLTLSQREREQLEEEVFDGIKVIRIKPTFSFGFKNGGFIPQLYKYLKKSFSNSSYPLPRLHERRGEPRGRSGGGEGVIYLHYPFFGGAEIIWLYKLLHSSFAKATEGKSKTKLIIHFHMDTPALSPLAKFLSIPSLLIKKSLFKRADKIISASLDYVQHSSIKEYYKKWPEKFTEIPFGVHLEKFHSLPHDIPDLQELRNKYEIQKDDKIIMFLGALDEAHRFKGVEVLLKACSNLTVEMRHASSLPNKDSKLLICGDGNLKNKYQELAKELKINKQVIFTGRVADEDLVKHYNLADVFVLPSTDQSEAFGIVLLEAMACGVPVIASDLPGVRSVFENNKQGLSVIPSDAEDLSNKLNQLLSSPEKIDQMGRAARELVEQRYSWEKVGERINLELRNKN
ncbi:MAG: glycosyltransferase family 4 protein [Candidatus Falkowbacteria bacterium]